jgi:hypothetical protein
VGVITRSFPPHPNPLPPRGEGRPFIPPAKLGGILAHFDKSSGGINEKIGNARVRGLHGEDDAMPFALHNPYFLNSFASST